MPTAPSGPPGRHERQLRRRWESPLFPDQGGDPEALRDARLRDRQESNAFLEALRTTVQRAVELSPREESQVVLDLKTDLDRLYETASSLGGDQRGNKEAIRRLVAIVMRAVWAGAEGDPQAEAELEQEGLARAAHFALLEEPLVADLLHPHSLISPQELVPTLLSVDAEALGAALELFDAGQLAHLAAEARALLEARDPQATALPEAWARLAQIAAARDAGGPA